VNLAWAETMKRQKAGFDAFRRFRASWLHKNRAAEDLIWFWPQHANQSVTNAYSRLSVDFEFRRDRSEKIGLGFEIPALTVDVVRSVPKNAGPALFEQALANQV
jgi:hypothetical protein